MAAAEIASRPAERQPHKRPFASWVKRLTNLNKSNSANKKAKKASKNNPYPESGRPNYQPNDSTSANDFATTPSRDNPSRDSYTSIPETRNADGHHVYNSSRSAAPTVATNPETIHSDAGYSRALTGTTAGGALSSVDGAGANSTFSSPNQSTRSLTTTLTTIQSTNALSTPTQSNTNAAPDSHNNQSANQPAIQFTHQYPVAASAIPAHLQAPAQQQHQPTTYASATAGNLLTDNASIMTLASSSKRRRRSMDTDASVRGMAPRSVWGDSRESLPLSVLSGNIDHAGTSAPSTRPANLTRDERASVYSNQGVSAPALASERNSFYASSHKAPTFKDRDDGRSVRSMHTAGPNTVDGRSVLNFDGASLRGYEGSIRNGALGTTHGRGDSVSGSPLGSPSLLRRPSGALSLDVREDAERKDNSVRNGREGH